MFFFFLVRLVFVINVSLFISVASATVKMDNEENLENVRYAMNDDTAGFINTISLNHLVSGYTVHRNKIHF